MQYLEIDWGTRRASWCAIDDDGTVREGMIPADRDGLARLVLTLGAGEVRGGIEMMSGAGWVRDELAQAGWDIRIVDARKVKAIAPLACKTDRVDARVLADLVRRDLLPELWVHRGTSVPTASGCDAALTWFACGSLRSIAPSDC